MTVFSRFLSDIRFWIILFFVLRLYGITNAPLEATHSWRQCLTNMQARNFLEVDNNIFYPRIDMQGEKTGIISAEFPLFNYLIYLWSLLFGYNHWAGRLINLFVSSIGAWFFYKIISEYFDKKSAFLSTLILLTSLWFSFSRKIMPDTFSVSLVLIGMYYGLKYLRQHNLSNLIFYVIFCCAGCLSKIPAMALMGVFVIPVISKETKRSNKLYFIIASLFVLILVGWWYFGWSQYLYETYGYRLYFYAESFSEAINQLFFVVGDKTLSVFYFNSLCGFIASGLFIIGLFLLIKKRDKKLFYLSLCIIPLLFLFMLKTGAAFSTHNYYVLPFVPFMALLGGYTLSHIKNNKIVYVILFASCTEGILNQQHDFKQQQNDHYLLSLESIADEVSSKKDLFVVNGNGSPQMLYFLHRRGWNLNVEEINKVALDSLTGKGAKFLLIDKKNMPTLPAFELHSLAYGDNHFIVFKLNSNEKN